ncbi:MAG: hypothetical protein WB610_01980, partial [Rhodomicrobium sp.]
MASQAGRLFGLEGEISGGSSQRDTCSLRRRVLNLGVQAMKTLEPAAGQRSKYDIFLERAKQAPSPR